MAKRAAFDMERFYQALGDTTRLRLLNLMGDKEICVCYLVGILGQPQPKISRHLAYLRRSGLVVARREGTWMHYSVAIPEHTGAAAVLEKTLEWMRTDRVMIADRERLSKLCCTTGGLASVAIAMAPASAG